MANVLIWADIPVQDMERARRFYGDLLQVEIMEMPGGGGQVAVPPPESGPIAFDLAKTDIKPSMDGPTIYFDANGDIDGMVRRAEAAGGTILQQPQDMGEMVGVIAFIKDTEGNRIGVRAPSAQKG